MKQFKKRTLALVLASAVTVVGAFEAEYYKNSLMSLKIDSDINNNVMLTLYTKQKYSENIQISQNDKYTYVINLPETNSCIDTQNALKNGIEYINVKTAPYTTESSGYTSVVIRTKQESKLSVQTALYLPNKNQTRYLGMKENYASGSTSKSQAYTANSTNKYQATRPSYANSNLYQPANTEPQPKSKNEITYLILIGALLVTLIIFFFTKAKDKMTEIIGEQQVLDLEDEEDKKKEETKEKNKATKNKVKIREASNNVKPILQYPENNIQEENVEKQQDEEENSIVDLDELLGEKNNQEQYEDADNNNGEENTALEEFLKDFKFEDDKTEETEENTNKVEEEIFNEKLYEDCINNNNLSFTKDDIDKMNMLLNLEIGDETKKHAKTQLISSQKETKPTSKELLENFVTLFTVQQNITFTKEDISALKKLMNVEIDNSFLTDIKTNPETIKVMQKEIMKHQTQPHKTSKLLTLKVKDVLPDLSLALKKQGKKRIESEVKPQVVYYSEGYDYKTLSTDDIELPDLSKEINNDDAYKARPSDKYKFVDDNFEISTMSTKDKLPDLQDMLNNPDKYETEEPEVEVVDEEALLKSIANVTFKPFDDGTRKFEIINDDIEEKEVDTPSVSDIQAEFEEVAENFEIVSEEENYTQLTNINEQDDFEALYNNEYFDLDKNDTNINSDITNDNDVLEEFWKDINETKKDNLIENKTIKIDESPIVEKIDTTEPNETKQDNNEIKTEKTSLPKFCILDNEKYTIISASEFTEKMGCYLTKNDNGYSIIGYVGDKIFKLKHYGKLNVSKLKTRATEMLDDGTIRYIVRIGIHKFVMNVKQDDMEFVMDLC